jgi:hypothetical protein
MTKDMILKLQELTYKHFDVLWETDEYGNLDSLSGEEDMMLCSMCNTLKDRMNGKS